MQGSSAGPGGMGQDSMTEECLTATTVLKTERQLAEKIMKRVSFGWNEATIGKEQTCCLNCYSDGENLGCQY